MKHMKRIFAALLLAVLSLSLCAFPALANNSTETTEEVIRYEDGSYLVVALTVSTTRAAGTRSGIKTGNYYDSDGELCWDFSIHGAFTYDGTTATATQASYSYNIYNSAWKLKSAEAYCSGDQAIAEGKFNGGFFLNRSTSITLTCSPTGVLS